MVSRSSDNKTGKNSIPALIVTQTRHLRDSLQMLLTLFPQVGSISVLEDTAAAQAMVAEHELALVLVDGALPGDDAPSLVRSIKSQMNTCLCVVLVDEIRQRRDFEMAGADLVVLKGYPAAKLRQDIEGLVLEGLQRATGIPSR